jgi:superfamily II DNA or RNA helicase
MLRDYQLRCVDGVRSILYGEKKRSSLLQLYMGGGKTAIVSEIIKTATGRGFRSWFVVPRNTLLSQSSEHLAKWHVPHGRIAAGEKESRAYNVHVVSLQTLHRRLDKIKNWPHIIFFDEAHTNYDGQKKIIERLPETTKIVGVTATPERLSGEPLSDIYEGVYYGPSIPWLTGAGYLSPLRYFAPPVNGLEKLKFVRGEVNAGELDELLKARKVYGKAVEYYARHGKKDGGAWRPAIGFCRDIKASQEAARQFREAGFLFEHIDGEMPAKKQRAIIDGLKGGKLHGVLCAELLTYGFDAPLLEYGFSLRPTLSRALYYQMVGRLLRIYPGKKDALFFDHANLIREHQDPSAPGVPLFYLENLSWNFHGRLKEKREKAASGVSGCPYNDYQYCPKKSCAGCALKPENEADVKKTVTLDVLLEEKKAPVKFFDLLPEEKQEVQDVIIKAKAEALEGMEAGEIRSGPVGELLAVAEKLGRNVMWVYWTLSEGRVTVNVPLLCEIGRQKNFKPGWAWIKAKEIRARNKEAV